MEANIPPHEVIRNESSMVQVGVKYCGGCQAGYDRTAALADIKFQCAHDTVFEPVQSERVYDFILVLNGCKVQCANIAGLQSRNGIFRMCDSADSIKAIEEIRNIKLQNAIADTSEKHAGLETNSTEPAA